MATRGLVAAAVLAASAWAVPGLAGPADDRFDDLDGPLAEFVLRPDDFGLDASRTMVDVPSLLALVDGARARSVVERLALPRSAADLPEARDAAVALVEDELRDAGYEPQRQLVTHPRTGVEAPNVYVDLPGTSCTSATLVVGAHWDAVAGTPGADDNATGVAALLEMARALRSNPLPVNVRFVAFAFEEDGLVGSIAMANEMTAQGIDVAGALSMDMLGFTKPDIDPLTGLPHTYLAMVADPTSSAMARAFGAAAYTYTPEFPAAAAVIDPAVLGDILRSDHAPFLAQGYPAMMATDTANFRNPHYHQPSDTPETLDWDYLTGSTRASLAGVATYGSIDDDQDGVVDLCDVTLIPPVTVTAPPPVTAPPSSAPPSSAPAPAEPVVVLGATRSATPATAVSGRPRFTG